MQTFQRTLKKEITLFGVGVHRGQETKIVIKPAPVDYGIVFTRFVNGKAHKFPALSAQTGETKLYTSLGQGEVRIETIEHLMAAIVACGLDNLDIEVSDVEVPIMDGASHIFMQAFQEVGVKEQEGKRQYLVIKQPVRVERGNDFAEFLPFDGCQYDVTISFDTPAIGTQNYCFDLNEDEFFHEISRARTFGFLKDVELLRANGMALGSSLENSIVIGFQDEIVNDSGLFYENEFVRHKLLDAIGDTALIGAPFVGLFRSFRGGHALNAQLVKKLLDHKNAYELRVF